VLSIVILTWNSWALLEECLAALPSATAPLATEIIVVDNGSRDGTTAGLARHPEITTITNVTNRGVAPGRNQGLCRARGEFAALLDVDTVPAPGAFATMVARLRADPAVGLVGPKLVDLDGGLQYSCRRFPTLLDKVCRRLPAGVGRALTVDYVIGACQVIRRAALDHVGLLDEHIFYGPEDVDLCLRLQRAGWKVEYVPDAVVMHLERRVTRKLLSSLTARHAYGLGYFFWKHRYLFRRPVIELERRAA